MSQSLHGPVRVGAVGVRPGDADGILGVVPRGNLFEIAAFSDEGLEPAHVERPPIPHVPDYNQLLDRQDLELVLVDGPVELRRDLAMRALKAGKHVVVARPFADTFGDAYKMARLARQQERLVTCEMPRRHETLFRKVRGAVGAGEIGEPFSIEYRLLLPDALDAKAEEGVLVQHGVDLIDQALLLTGHELKDVRAFVRENARELDWHFRIHVTLRHGGWLAVEMMKGAPGKLPPWTVIGETGILTTPDGASVHISDSSGQRTPSAEFPLIDFWPNVYDAIRSGMPLENTARQIVRAFRVWEAAMTSIEEDMPISV